jgi:membrane peptidoglycan carboxypeptidase
MRKLLIRTAVFLAGFAFIAGSVLFALAYFTVNIPDPNAFVNSQSTIIQYSNGSEIGRVGTQNRQIVPLAEIPLNVRYAVLAAEDRGFYSNRAFSVTGILRAIVNNLKGGSLQGGSTITQQYAKTAFLTPSRTIQRKIKELVISIKLENQLSKDQIFESYLNTIYFGRGSYGVMTASQQYFNRNVDQLTNAQAAVIASILRSPGLYDPAFKEGNLERLQARFEYVKKGMIDAGWLDKAAAAKMKFPEVAPRATSGQLSGPKGHLIEAVTKELAKLGFSQDQLLVGGLVIKTTLDQKAQQSAVDAVTKFYPKKAPADLRIGLAAIRPGTGEVLALYGGRDYLERQLNDATQSITQPGSNFKPFALIAALEQGIPPVSYTHLTLPTKLL